MNGILLCHIANLKDSKMIEHSQPTIEEDDINAVIETLKSKWIGEGVATNDFVKKMSSYIGVRGGVATCSGTAAIHLALCTLDVSEGDEVIIPSYVCNSLLHAIYLAKATPRIVDVEERNYNISPDEVEQAVNIKTKAIIVPHMFGKPANLDELMDLGIPIIEDCAQAIGAYYKNRRVGSIGDLSIFSFGALKMLTSGEGGMALSKSREMVEKMQLLKNTQFEGYRMSDIQAALGYNQLQKLDDFIKRRKKIANIYYDILSDYEHLLPEKENHIFYRFIIKTKGNIQKYIEEALKYRIIIRQPIAPESLHQQLNLNRNKYPVTEELMKTLISIPIYPSLSESNAIYIASSIKKLLDTYESHSY